MKHLSILMLLVVGMMITACEKDDPVPAPSNQNTMSIRFKTPKGVANFIIGRSNTRFVNVVISPARAIDTIIFFNDLKDSTYFFFNGVSPINQGEVTFIVNGVVKKDTTFMDGDYIINYMHNVNFQTSFNKY